MGGLGPGIGGGEWFVIGLVALLVVGPERLPGLLRQLGKMVAKARGMANEFRASFDEMARQSELDDLRKEVEALRTGQGALGSPVSLGAEASTALKDIKSEIDKPLFAAATPAQAATPTATTKWPDGDPVMLPIADPPLVQPNPVAVETAAKTRKPAVASSKAAKAKPAIAKDAKTTAAKPATGKPATPKSSATAPAKPKAPRKTPIRNTKLDL